MRGLGLETRHDGRGLELKTFSTVLITRVGICLKVDHSIKF